MEQMERCTNQSYLLKKRLCIQRITIQIEGEAVIVLKEVLDMHKEAVTTEEQVEEAVSVEVQEDLGVIQKIHMGKLCVVMNVIAHCILHTTVHVDKKEKKHKVGL